MNTKLTEFDKAVIVDALIDRIAKLAHLETKVALPKSQEAAKEEREYMEQLIAKVTNLEEE